MLNSRNYTKPKKAKRNKIKKEKPEPPPPPPTQPQPIDSCDLTEKDLTHYIKDRVELMRQVYSVLKDRELLAMAPGCLRGLKADDLQELCLEEVLGISSKRLRSVLDGYECPSDTESSSSSIALETISLDSISSDEEVLVSSHKKKHTKKKKSAVSGSAPKEKKKKSQPMEVVPSAGMTALELLELQARARAIRAQLAVVRPNKDISEEFLDNDEDEESERDQLRAGLFSDSADEVQIKEEPPDVVQIDSSSDSDEGKKKTKTSTVSKQALSKTGQFKVNSNAPVSKSLSPEPSTSTQTSAMQQSPTPQLPPRKIKLNRNNLFVSLSNASNIAAAPVEKEKDCVIINLDTSTKNISNKDNQDKTDKITEEERTINVTVNDNNVLKKSDKEGAVKAKIKKNKKKKSVKRKKNGSDDDELLLELSDSEKMDLLESFDTSDDSSESEADNEKDELNNTSTVDIANKEEFNNVAIQPNVLKKNIIDIGNDVYSGVNEGVSVDKDSEKEKLITENQQRNEVEITINESTCPEIANKTSDDIIEGTGNTSKERFLDGVNVEDVNTESENLTKKKLHSVSTHIEKSQNEGNLILNIQEMVKETVEERVKNSELDKTKEDAELSEGECSYSSDGLEITESKPDVVCISDSDDGDGTGKRRYRKRKKSSEHGDDQNFQKREDENFFREDVNLTEDINQGMESCNHEKELNATKVVTVHQNEPKYIDKGEEVGVDVVSMEENIIKEEDNVVDFEIFEISDESSGDEFGLSKEPTTEEIEELSRKIDTEIEREDIVFEKNISGDVDISIREEMESLARNKNALELSDISWKERWLESDKVKKVLATSNLCNALRKKNKELKKKLAEDQKIAVEQKLTEAKEKEGETKSKEGENQDTAAINDDLKVDEGSINQYQMLTGSTKYVSPVIEKTEEIIDTQEKKLSMAKDAKQLMKMYKKLLKIHEKRDGENKEKDRKERKEKKKKKKEKKEKKRKKKEETNEVGTSVEAEKLEGSTGNKTSDMVENNPVSSQTQMHNEMSETISQTELPG